jgi:hypothetical protein
MISFAVQTSNLRVQSHTQAEQSYYVILRQVSNVSQHSYEKSKRNKR